MSKESIGTDVRWSTSLENVLVTTGEKANGLSILHKKAESLYSQRRNFIDLPVIVLSSAVGFLSVGSSALFDGNQKYVSTALGVASLCVSVLNTVGSYFRGQSAVKGIGYPPSYTPNCTGS
jgi:hypothetical protein